MLVLLVKQNNLANNINGWRVYKFKDRAKEVVNQVSAIGGKAIALNLALNIGKDIMKANWRHSHGSCKNYCRASKERNEF